MGMSRALQNLQDTSNSQVIALGMEITQMQRRSDDMFRKTAEEDGPDIYFQVLKCAEMLGNFPVDLTPLVAAAICYVSSEIVCVINEEIERRIESGEMSAQQKQEAEDSAREFIAKVEKYADESARLFEMKKQLHRDDNEDDGND